MRCNHKRAQKNAACAGYGLRKDTGKYQYCRCFETSQLCQKYFVSGRPDSAGKTGKKQLHQSAERFNVLQSDGRKRRSGIVAHDFFDLSNDDACHR